MLNYYTNERKEIYPFIPENITKTLDIGCATGGFSAGLKAVLNIETWGIEIVESAAKEADLKLDKVLHGSYDEVSCHLPKNYFDCIFFNDVLEHMTNPESCLLQVKENLAEGGHIVASIPNMRYVEVLKELIFKKDWKYKDSGILDKTHLRFYTKKSMRRMIEDCGFKVEQMEGIRSVGPYCLTSIINFFLLNKLEDIKHQQYVIVASVK